ncbi:hypothetical protein AB1L30_21610 [Bremerella sp. JC817]|uniref:hypothetical protein n=1 Tax=Bremerella sp. JC817 TaxID=3231756 RepID=UPI0034573B86
MLLLVLCLQVELRPSYADEQVLASDPVPIRTTSDSTMFPASWRKAPISASGKKLDAAQHERALKIVGEALRKYPARVIEQNLDAVYLLSNLSYSGVSTSGTNSRTVVYVTVDSPRRGFTDQHIEAVFHAEFSSILLRNFPSDFDATAWLAACPEGFEYLGNGVDAIKQNKSSLRSDTKLHSAGFLRQYAQSTMENDFNGFAAFLFSGDKATWEIVQSHPRLKQKLNITLNFFQKIDPALTQDYFEGLHQERRK